MAWHQTVLGHDVKHIAFFWLPIILYNFLTRGFKMIDMIIYVIFKACLYLHVMFVQNEPNHFSYLMFNSLKLMTHIYVSTLSIIGSDNGFSRLAGTITWTNAGILLIWPLGTNFSEMLMEIHTFSFKKMHLKMSSGKWRPFCLYLHVLKPLVSVAACHWQTFPVTPVLHYMWCIQSSLGQIIWHWSDFLYNQLC